MNNLKSKEKKPFFSESGIKTVLTAAVILAVLAFSLVLYFLTITFGLYIIPDERDELVLSGSTDGLFAEANKENKKVRISFCIAEDQLINHETGSYVYRTVTEFAERYSFIELEYINIITQKNSKNEYVDFDRFKTNEQGDETVINKSSVIFECGDRYRVITDNYSNAGFANFFTLDSSGQPIAYTGEEFTASMISWVLRDSYKMAYFTIGHSEQFDTAFATLFSAAGYYIDYIDLSDPEVTRVPEDCDLLIISNPKNDFEMGADETVYTEKEKIETYIGRGGSIYVSLDPYVKKLPVLEGILSQFGIAFSESSGELGLRDVVRDNSSGITTDGFTFVASIAEEGVSAAVSESVLAYSSGSVITREAAALNLFGNAKPLLISSPSSYCEVGGEVTREGGGFAVSAYSELPAEDGKSARIVVVPSIYTALSDSLVTNGYSNKDFYFAVFEKVYGATYLPYGCYAVLYENDVTENLTMSEAKLYTSLILLVPAAIAVTGAVILIRRKNR